MLTPEQEKKLQREATMREVYDLRVYVVGGGFQYCKMFYEAGMRGAKSAEDADIICFTGGEDVNPALYNEKPLAETFFNAKRDDEEAFLYGFILEKPKIGICRGGQFLNVMNGGKLWQDVNNHANREGHSVIDIRSGETKYNMTSTHHQQMIPGKGAEILATASLSTKKKNDTQIIQRDVPENDDMEVLWYPETSSLCFQPHPEFRHGDCRNYFLDLVDEFILPLC